eukprot:3635-Chlamydomonas_euryale.AAC.7
MLQRTGPSRHRHGSKYSSWDSPLAARRTAPSQIIGQPLAAHGAPIYQLVGSPLLARGKPPIGSWDSSQLAFSPQQKIAPTHTHIHARTSLHTWMGRSRMRCTPSSTKLPLPAAATAAVSGRIAVPALPKNSSAGDQKVWGAVVLGMHRCAGVAQEQLCG